MKKYLPAAILVLALGLLIFRDTQEEPHLFSGIAMTIPYRILIGQPLNILEKYQMERGIHEVFSHTHRVYNKWNPDSELSHFNRSPKNSPIILSKELLYLLHQTDRMWRLTEGRFDPTIETSLSLWKEALKKGEEIDLGPSKTGWNHLGFAEGALFKKMDGLQIDLGGIAKGQTIDELIEMLQTRGVVNALVEWGGDFRAIGKHPSGRDWAVSIKNPQGGIFETVPLQECALATSGDYEQYWITQGGKYFTHIIDPTTSRPLERKKGSILSCSVQAPTCLEADALATALMLFEKGEELEKWTTAFQAKHPKVSFKIFFFEE